MITGPLRAANRLLAAHIAKGYAEAGYIVGLEARDPSHVTATSPTDELDGWHIFTRADGSTSVDRRHLLR